MPGLVHIWNIPQSPQDSTPRLFDDPNERTTLERIEGRFFCYSSVGRSFGSIAFSGVGQK